MHTVITVPITTESVYHIRYHSTYATIHIMQNTIVKYFCAKLLMYSVWLLLTSAQTWLQSIATLQQQVM